MSELNIIEILKLLPHRYPFVLVDRVLKVVPGESIQAIKNVTINEPFFMGHFPEFPVMPGVLILEAMAQVMGILAFKTREAQGMGKEDGKIFYFAGIDSARFKKPVTPGDQLLIEVKLIKIKNDVIKAEATVLVQGDLACSAELMGAYKGI